MARTPLQEALLAQSGGRLQPLASADYRGAETAARFGNPQEEFSTLRGGCGVYDFGFRGWLSITGGDRVRWLNGMVTNNIRDLAVGRGVYAFLLNPQGRILGDMNVYNLGERLALETDRSQLEKIMATFDHFIIMDDVEVANVSETHTSLGLAGAQSRAILNGAGIEVPEMRPLHAITPRCSCDCGCVECTVMRDEDALGEMYEVCLAPKDVYKTWQALVAAGAMPVGSEAVEARRIAAGVPLYGVDIRERDLPQETEQARALNFNKGCYVGQEIVERIRSRGNVHRKFTGFAIDGEVGIASGSKIVSGEKEVGEITSVAVLRATTGARTIALGYIRREIGTPGREVTVGGIKATVVSLPFEISRQDIDDAVLHVP